MATRHGGDKRGNSTTRRARKNWLLGAIADKKLGMAPFGGNGQSVPCVFCQCELTYATLEADRVIPGGSYRRENVQPACRPCNLARSDDMVTPEEIALRVQRTFARTGRLTPALAIA